MVWELFELLLQLYSSHLVNELLYYEVRSVTHLILTKLKVLLVISFFDGKNQLLLEYYFDFDNRIPQKISVGQSNMRGVNAESSSGKPIKEPVPSQSQNVKLWQRNLFLKYILFVNSNCEYNTFSFFSIRIIFDFLWYSFIFMPKAYIDIFCLYNDKFLSLNTLLNTFRLTGVTLFSVQKFRTYTLYN